MSNHDVRTRDVVLLVGAEGVSETEGLPWIREATTEEALSWRAELEAPREINGSVVSGRTDVKGLFIDGMGRPYFLMVVTREAPLHVWLHASSNLRVLRLKY